MSFFVLKNYSTLSYDGVEVNSNEVVVLSPLRRYFNNSYGCGTPYWRY